MVDKKMLFWDWVRAEAENIHSDGCSGVPDFYKEACLQHDLSYFYARCPVSAYKCYLEGIEDVWGAAQVITKAHADAVFRRTIQAKSKLKRFSPMSWWRWLGVKWFAGKAWNSHKDTQGK